MKFNQKELFILNKYFGNFKYKIEQIERRSDKEFDFNISGQYFLNDLWYKFSAWLPLYVIRENNWISFASMSDYPAMVLAGDWSGIRDSSEEKIWKMFEKCINQ